MSQPTAEDRMGTVAKGCAGLAGREVMIAPPFTATDWPVM